MRPFLPIALLMLSAAPAHADSLVQACEDYANQIAKEESGGTFQGYRFTDDENVSIDKYARKVGSQYIATVITGNGVLKTEKQVPVQFTCLSTQPPGPLFVHVKEAGK